jgi:cytidine deaminase
MRLPEPADEELISSAASVINPKMVGANMVGDRLFGDVGCALITRVGNLYLGVCIDTASSTGFCAEHSAIAARVTAGEYNVKKIVAVWKDDNGAAHVLSPCGRCREFLRQIDEDNLDTDVILGRGKVSKLKDLLPHHEWAEPLV